MVLRKRELALQRDAEGGKGLEGLRGNLGSEPVGATESGDLCPVNHHVRVPAPAEPTGHVGWIGRLAEDFHERIAVEDHAVVHVPPKIEGAHVANEENVGVGGQLMIHVMEILPRVSRGHGFIQAFVDQRRRNAVRRFEYVAFDHEAEVEQTADRRKAHDAAHPPRVRAPWRSFRGPQDATGEDREGNQYDDGESGHEVRRQEPDQELEKKDERQHGV